MNGRAWANAYTVAVVFLGSFAGVLAKFSLATINPFTFVWLQIAIEGIALCLYTFWWRGERIPKNLAFSVWLHLLSQICR